MRIHSRVGIACAAAAALVAGSDGVATGAGSGAGTVSAMGRAAFLQFPAFAGVPDSRALDLPVMLHGRLTDTLGNPLGRAQVLLAAWPSNDVIHDLPIGGHFSVTPVAQTVAGADGSYELRALFTGLLDSMTTRDGLDVELDVFHGGRHYTYLSQVKPDRASGGWFRGSADGLLRARASQAATPRNELHVALQRDAGYALGPDLLRPALPSDHRPPAPPGCGPYEKEREESAMTTVATVVAHNGMKTKVEYSREATSSLTTGASKDGSLAVLPAGSRERTAGFGAVWEHKAKRGETMVREYRVRWLHTIEKRLCAKDFQGRYEVARMTSPDRARPGVDSQISTRYKAWKCNMDFADMLDATEVQTENKKAYTYGADWTLPVTKEAGLIGSARSGYSDQVKIIFTAPNPGRAYWCGSSGDSLAPGQRVQAVQQ